MDPVTISLAAAGLLSSLMGSAAAQQKQKQTALMQAASEKAAPWLALAHAAPDQTKTEFAAPVAGSAIQGILGGIGQGQAIQNASQKDAMNKALLQYYTNLNPQAVQQMAPTDLAGLAQISQGQAPAIPTMFSSAGGQ